MIVVHVHPYLLVDSLPEDDTKKFSLPWHAGQPVLTNAHRTAYVSPIGPLAKGARTEFAEGIVQLQAWPPSDSQGHVVAFSAETDTYLVAYGLGPRSTLLWPIGHGA